MVMTPEKPATPTAGGSPAPLDGGAPRPGASRSLEGPAEQGSARRDSWLLVVLVLAIVAVLFSVIGIGLGLRAVDEAKHPTADTDHRSGTAAAAAAVVPITLTDFRVQVAARTISPGTVNLHIVNGGLVAHELLVIKSDLAPSAYPMKDGDIDEEGAGITMTSDGENIDPGAHQTRSVDLSEPGTYLFVCNLPNHFKAGMYSVVTVK